MIRNPDKDKFKSSAVLTEQQYRIEALQNKIEELKAILQVNNLI